MRDVTRGRDGAAGTMETHLNHMNDDTLLATMSQKQISRVLILGELFCEAMCEGTVAPAAAHARQRAHAPLRTNSRLQVDEDGKGPHADGRDLPRAVPRQRVPRKLRELRHENGQKCVLV